VPTMFIANHEALKDRNRIIDQLKTRTPG